MKIGFGKLILLLFLLAVPVYVLAEDEVIPGTLNFDNECQEPMGFIRAFNVSTHTYSDYVIVGPYLFGGGGGYFAKAVIGPTGSIGYTCRQIYWHEYPEGTWQYITGSPYCSSYSSCGSDFLEYVGGLTNEERLDIEATYEGYFPPESRYDLTADDDEDGMLDYYDLDCPRYEEYLQYCEENGIEPLDLVDYQYFQDHSLEEYLAQRQNMNDTDGDGFSDGYEAIHGTEMYDGSDYPLGRPDTGESLLIVGGVDEEEPWRLEQYNDSGYSRGFVYDHGYDPFGSETLSFEDDPDWGLLDSDNDGLVNYAELANGTDPYRFEFQSGFSYAYDENGGFYYLTGYTEDGAFGDYGDAPTEEEWLAAHEDYEIGDYAYNPSEYAFGDEKYDGLLSKTSRIKFDCDNVRPQTQRDYKLYFTLPIPGEGTQTFAVSVMPDTSTPAGAAMEIVRQLIRGMSGVIFSYVFIKHVWLAIRQY